MAKNLPGVVRRYMNLFPRQPVTSDDMAKYTGVELSAIHEAIHQGISSKEIMPIGDQGFYLIKQFGMFKDNLLSSVTELLENDLLKKSVNIEELRNRFGKNFDKLLFQNALDDLCREHKLIKESGGFRTPKRFIKLNSALNQLVGQVFHHAKVLGIMPFSLGQLIELTQKKYPKKDIQKVLTFLTYQGKFVQLNDDRFLTIEAIEEVKQRIQKIISEKKSFTLSDSTEILGFGRTKGAPIFDYLDSVGFTKREGNLRTLK
jgi:selenocysteine-specific elongation factor